MINDTIILKYSIISEKNESDTMEYIDENSEVVIRKRDYTFCLQVENKNNFN